MPTRTSIIGRRNLVPRAERSAGDCEVCARRVMVDMGHGSRPAAESITDLCFRNSSVPNLSIETFSLAELRLRVPLERLRRPARLEFHQIRHQLTALLLRIAALPPSEPAVTMATGNDAYRRFRRELEDRFASTHRVEEYAAILGYSAKTSIAPAGLRPVTVPNRSSTVASSSKRTSADPHRISGIGDRPQTGLRSGDEFRQVLRAPRGDDSRQIPSLQQWLTFHSADEPPLDGFYHRWSLSDLPHPSRSGRPLTTGRDSRVAAPDLRQARHVPPAERDHIWSQAATGWRRRCPDALVS